MSSLGQSVLSCYAMLGKQTVLSRNGLSDWSPVISVGSLRKVITVAGSR